jgi:hypothetical protein
MTYRKPRYTVSNIGLRPLAPRDCTATISREYGAEIRDLSNGNVIETYWETVPNFAMQMMRARCAELNAPEMSPSFIDALGEFIDDKQAAGHRDSDILEDV